MEYAGPSSCTIAVMLRRGRPPPPPTPTSLPCAASSFRALRDALIFYIVAEVVKPDDVTAAGGGGGGGGSAGTAPGAEGEGRKKQVKLPKCASASELAAAIMDPALKGARTRVRCVSSCSLRLTAPGSNVCGAL